jgi:CxxC motif-containing protein
MKELICIVCPKGCHLKVDENDNYSVTGNDCPRGAEYGKKELTAPTRVITSTVKVRGGLYCRCPVKTAAPIPKGLIFEAMKLLDNVELQAPVRVGDVVIEDICGTGIPFVAARNL